jgi:hypothetical protein
MPNVLDASPTVPRVDPESQASWRFHPGPEARCLLRADSWVDLDQYPLIWINTRGPGGCELIFRLGLTIAARLQGPTLGGENDVYFAVSLASSARMF